MTDLLVAAGGGGDPIGTALVHAAVGRDPDAVVLTYSWERLAVDPVPGPLAPRDLTGLDHDTLPVPLLTPRSAPIGPRGSTLPRLAGQLPVRLALLDPYSGVDALAEQIAGTAKALDADRIRIVDVGGDILAHGDEPTLASPLPDALALAACHLTGVPTTVHLAGPGLDGEVPETMLLHRLGGASHALGSGLPSWAREVMRWHPTEAGALLAAAATGLRGPCLTREGARPVPLTDLSGRVWSLPAADALEHNRLARALVSARPATLAGAEAVSREVYGFSEVERERLRARSRRESPRQVVDEQPFLYALDAWLELLRARQPEVRYATVRCAVESLGLHWGLTERIRDLIRTHRPALDAFPLLALPG